jgi:hypothetical protein
MWKDPIVEEIHHIREKIAKECNYDLKQIMKRLKRSEKEHAGQIVYKKLRTRQGKD